MDLSKELEQIKCSINNLAWQKILIEIAEIIVDESEGLPEVIGGRIKRLIDKKIKELEENE